MDPQRHNCQRSPAAEGDHTAFLPASPMNPPLNLTEWVRPELLAQWAREAVKDLDLLPQNVPAPVLEKDEARLRSNLAVLVYAYATQVYVNDEIIRACYSAPTFQELCGHLPPFPEELKHIRRKFRGPLENGLTRILVRAVQEKYLEMGDLPPGLQYCLSGRAADQLDIARHIDTWND